MTPDEILAKAREAKAKGWKFQVNTFGDPEERCGCLMGAVAAQAGCPLRAGDHGIEDAARALGVSYEYAAGLARGFDRDLKYSDAPDYHAGYALGRQARAEFLTA
jgi:hypothetical protein